MKTILDIATILGGITALWFIWDKVLVFWKARRKKESNEKHSFLSIGHFQLSLNREQIPTVIFCAVSGICCGIIGGRIGYDGLTALSFLLGLVTAFSAAIFYDSRRYEAVHNLLLFGGVFIICWGMIAGIIAMAIEDVSGIRFTGIIPGILLSVIGGTVGVVFGARITN